jgi:uncharacterized surface protein with fasciclin (FAS1) repeats
VRNNTSIESNGAHKEPTNKHMIRKSIIIVTLGIAAFAATSFAYENPKVGGAAMSQEKNIVQNASASADHTTLVAALKAADLVATLEGTGPFTVFAPTNEAFEKLPAGTLDTLLKPENKKKLAAILTYHVLPGKVTAKELVEMIKAGDGKAKLKTVNGEVLTASKVGDFVVLTDAKGGNATVTVADAMQSNGVIHVIGAVLMP